MKTRTRKNLSHLKTGKNKVSIIGSLFLSIGILISITVLILTYEGSITWYSFFGILVSFLLALKNKNKLKPLIIKIFRKLSHMKDEYIYTSIILIGIIVMTNLWIILLPFALILLIFFPLRSKLYRLKGAESNYTYSKKDLSQILNNNNYYGNKEFKSLAQKKIFHDIHYYYYILSMFKISVVNLIILFITLYTLSGLNISNFIEGIFIIGALLLAPISLVLFHIYYKSLYKKTETDYIYEHLPKSTLYYRRLSLKDSNPYIFSSKR